MKLVRGIVREEKLNDVIRALDDAGVSGMTMTRVTGRGATKHVGMFRGYAYPVLMPMCAIDVMVDDNRADDVARLMVDGAHTGHKGDGHVYVVDVDQSYSVRTRWLEVA